MGQAAGCGGCFAFLAPADSKPPAIRVDRVKSRESGHDTESEEEIQGEIVGLLEQKASRKKKKIRAVNWAAINFSKPMRDRENAWLRQVLEHIRSQQEAGEGRLLRKLVSHRGFHFSNDSLLRPLENSVEAYEAAWEAGIHKCECDIVATLDKRIVLLHDTNTKRVWGMKSFNSGSQLSLLPAGSSNGNLVDKEARNTPVTQLRHSYLERNVAVKTEDGTLTELTKVLESAREISERKQDAVGGVPAQQMVVEIKQEPGPYAQEEKERLVDALFLRFETNPELYLYHICTIMSFDQDIMQRICKLFYEQYWPKVVAGEIVVEGLPRNLSGLPRKLPPKPTFMLLRCCTCDTPEDIANFGDAHVEENPTGKSLEELQAAAEAGEKTLTRASLIASDPNLAMFNGLMRIPGAKDAENTRLDGVYLEFQQNMANNAKIQEQMFRLSRVGKIGIWIPGSLEENDRFPMCKRLSDLGCTYVNTDLYREWIDGGAFPYVRSEIPKSDSDACPTR